MITNPFPLLATLLAVSVCAWAAAPSATAAADQVQTATSPAREVRQRRMIFDNDGNEPHFLKALTAEDVLQQRTAALAGSQVDTLFYCTTDAFGITKRPSKVWQLFDSKTGTYQRNRTVELAAAGVDVLRVMVEFGHKNGMEVFANIRMNDVHDGGRAPDNLTRFKDNQFKAAHPDYLVGKKERQPRTGAWSAVNFALPEVREHLFRYLEESCREYNIDGLALDFFRHPCFFKSTFNGKPCTDAERAAMSELIQRVRMMMREVAAKRGRPLLLSVRVPDSAAYCRDLGLDLEHWLREGWLDLLVVTSYFQISDWSASVALGHKYGVPVYPSLDEARGKDASALTLRSSLLAYRGRAAAAWGAGMDGILLFNFTEPAAQHWRQLGDAKALAGMEKDFFASILGKGTANGGNLPYDRYLTVETINPNHPRPVAAGKPATASIRLGAIAQNGLHHTLRLRFAGLVAPDSVEITFDGNRLAGLRAEGDWLEARLTAQDFKLTTPALHEVVVSLRSGTKPLSWLDLMVTERK